MAAQGAGPAAVGLLAGAAASRPLGRLVQPLLFGISAGDPLTLPLVLLLLALTIVSSCYLPARRAGRIDPQSALRHKRCEALIASPGWHMQCRRFPNT